MTTLRRGVAFACVLVPVLAAAAPRAQQPQPERVHPPPSAAAAPAWADAARAAIDAQRQRDGIPGISCAIAVGDDLPFRVGLGLADVENDVPATAATVYRLASISKPVTAVLALQLAEAGELDLDADVATLVPEWSKKPWPVTTRQLLAHLGGVRHYRRGEAESTRHYATQAAGLARFAADDLLHEPGTAYHYSTYGFNLVAAVVEARAGKPFAAVLQQRIAVPCGAGTLQDDDVQRIIRNRAQGYVKRDGELRNSELMDGSYKLGGGGLCASAEDLARFAQALVAGKLLRAETLAAMWTRQRTTAGKEITYGLGWRVDRDDGRLVVSHSGAQSRVSTMLCVLPEPKVAVALLCNLEGVRLQPLSKQLALLAAGVPLPVK
jgi:serine beta-lactamase-like protein LACTB